jgi:anti-sigma-K factor RskA
VEAATINERSMIVFLRTEAGAMVTNFFDTSSIPETDAYWNSLAARVTRAAQARRSGLGWLGAERSALLAAACIVAIAAAIGIASRRELATAPVSTLLVALMPSDAIGRIIVGAQEPPAVAALAAMSPRVGGDSP